MSPAATIRILLADDQALVRGALAALLDLEDDLEVVAEVGRGDEVLPAVERAHPDVCLLDIEMPGLDGLTVAELIAESANACRVLIVTTFSRPGYLRRALDAGVSGFLVKDTPPGPWPTPYAASTRAFASWTPPWRRSPCSAARTR